LKDPKDSKECFMILKDYWSGLERPSGGLERPSGGLRTYDLIRFAGFRSDSWTL